MRLLIALRLALTLGTKGRQGVLQLTFARLPGFKSG